MNRNELTEAFSKASYTYNDVAEVQKSAAYDLVSLIDVDHKASSILDIGCGTGYAGLALYDRYPDAEYTLCDISQSMLQVASKTFPKEVKAICCDAEYYDFNHYDIIISNLSIQWFSDTCEFIRRIKENCDLFAFTTLLDTSFECYKRLFDIPPTFNYPSLEKLQNLVDYDYYQKRRYTVKLDNFLAVIRYFRRLGACLTSSENATSIPLDFGPIVLEYDVFFGIIQM